MSRAHVYPLREVHLHDTERGADCICEPRIIFYGTDDRGEKAIVFVHSRLQRPDMKGIHAFPRTFATG